MGKKAAVVQYGDCRSQFGDHTGQFQRRSDTSGTKAARPAAAMHFGKGGFVNKFFTHFAV